MKQVLFKYGTGVGIFSANQEILNTITIEEIAPIIVPEGVPYLIIDAVDIPTDRTLRDAWEWDESSIPSGYGSGIKNID